MTLSFLTAAALALATQTTGDKLTLDEALSIAVDQAFTIRTADSNILKAGEIVRENQAAQGIRLNGSATYLRYGFEQTASIGGQNVVFQPLDTTSVGATLGYTVDLSGNTRRLVNAARKRTDAAKISRFSTVNDVRLAVRKAYYGVLRAKSLVTVQEQALANIIARVDQTQKQFNADSVAKIDLERYQAQQASTEADLISARNSLQIAKQQLNQAIARPIESSFDTVDVATIPSTSVDTDTLVKAGQSVRPEVKSLKTTIQAQSLTKRATLQTLEPSLNFQIAHSRTLDPAGLNPQNESTTTTLSLAIPFWDSGLTKARVKQVDQDIRQSQINLEQTQLSISQEVRTAVATYKTAQARMESGTRQVALAREVARLARIRRDAGEGTVLEIIDAETSLTQAENALINSRYDMLAAYADLQRAVGNDDINAAISEATNAATPGTK